MLTLWHPHRDLNRLTRNLDEMFGWTDQTGRAAAFAPAVDIEEGSEAFTLRADLPGLTEKEIDVRVDGQELVISGTREGADDHHTKGLRVRERSFGKFVRRFRLGNQIRRDAIEASYTNGVLTVVIPKSEELKPRQIPVAVN